jgi:anti-sigma28 factor (negative regulator of flagellin synthesis)
MSNSDNSNSGNTQKPPRRKGLTSLTLQWLADKLRRTDKIREELSQGRYEVDSSKVAQAMMGPGAHNGDEQQH